MRGLDNPTAVANRLPSLELGMPNCFIPVVATDVRARQCAAFEIAPQENGAVFRRRADVLPRLCLIRSDRGAGLLPVLVLELVRESVPNSVAGLGVEYRARSGVNGLLVKNHDRFSQSAVSISC